VYVAQARKWLRKAAEEPSGVFLATDAYAKDQFDGAQFEEEECDRDLSQVHTERKSEREQERERD